MWTVSVNATQSELNKSDGRPHGRWNSVRTNERTPDVPSRDLLTSVDCIGDSLLVWSAVKKRSLDVSKTNDYYHCLGLAVS